MASALTGASLLGVGNAQAAPEPLVAVAPTVAPCAAVTTGSPIIVPNDFTPALSDTRSAGHYELSGTSLHVYTDDASSQAKVAEYVTVAATPLSLVGEPSLAWTGSAIPPGTQLLVDLENDGTPDGILVGEPAYYGNRWWASSTLRAHIGLPVPPALVSPGGDGSAVAGTLNDWLASYPNAQVRAVGFSLGSGVLGNGSIASITFACVKRSFAAPAPVPVRQCESPATQPTSTNLDQRGWVLKHDAVYVPGGIQLSSTGGADGHGGVIYKAVNFPLSDAANLARDLSITAGSGASFAIQMDTDTGATVTYEPYYSDQLWTDTPGILPRNNPAPGNNNGQGGPYSGSLSDLLSNPTVTDVWIGIFNTDEVAILHSVSFDCQTQPFDYMTPVVQTTPVVQPTPPAVTPVVAPSPSASAVLAATGPAQASSGLLLGLIALLSGMALVGIGAVRRTGSSRQH